MTAPASGYGLGTIELWFDAYSGFDSAQFVTPVRLLSDGTVGVAEALQSGSLGRRTASMNLPAVGDADLTTLRAWQAAASPQTFVSPLETLSVILLSCPATQIMPGLWSVALTMIEASGAGAVAMPSARISEIATARQLGDRTGYIFTGVALTDWDDAGYFVAYGTRSGADLDPAATCVIVPTAGRYRFAVHAEFDVYAGGDPNLTPHAYIVAEKDTACSSFEITEHVIVRPQVDDWATPTPYGSLDVGWEGDLDAGGAICFYSENSNDAADDTLNGYMTIERIG